LVFHGNLKKILKFNVIILSVLTAKRWGFFKYYFFFLHILILLLQQTFTQLFTKPNMPLFGKYNKPELFYIEKKNFYVKKLFHIKCFANRKDYVYFELNTVYNLEPMYEKQNTNLDGNFFKINAFFRIKPSIAVVRLFMMRELNI
jgi:hypothetical protein